MECRTQGNLTLVDFANGYRIIIEETAHPQRASLWSKDRVMKAWSELDHHANSNAKIAEALEHLLDDKDLKSWGNAQIQALRA